jgi:hypothetical protein
MVKSRKASLIIRLLVNGQVLGSIYVQCSNSAELRQSFAQAPCVTLLLCSFIPATEYPFCILINSLICLLKETGSISVNITLGLGGC